MLSSFQTMQEQTTAGVQQLDKNKGKVKARAPDLAGAKKRPENSSLTHKRISKVSVMKRINCDRAQSQALDRNWNRSQENQNQSQENQQMERTPLQREQRTVVFKDTGDGNDDQVRGGNDPNSSPQGILMSKSHRSGSGEAPGQAFGDDVHGQQQHDMTRGGSWMFDVAPFDEVGNQQPRQSGPGRKSGPEETSAEFFGSNPDSNVHKDTQGMVSYRDTVPVEIKVVIVRIQEIDTINQQFEAEIYLQARWAENQFRGLSEKELEEIEFFQCWDPQLKLFNLVGEPDMDTTTMVLRYEPDRVYPVLTLMKRVKGIFREHLELQHFPFDVQELSIVLSSDRSVKEIELVSDFIHTSSVNPQAMQESQDWLCYSHIEFSRDIRTEEMMMKSRHPILVAAAHVQRRLGFYFWNIFLIVVLILVISICLLAVEPTGNDRLSMTITLFLTAVAFKLVVKTTLPTISYLTYLDIYVIFALIYLTLSAAENALMTHLAKYRSSDKVVFYDEIAQSALITLLVLFHLVFFIYIQLTALQRRRNMKQKDYQLQLAKLAQKQRLKKVQNEGPEGNKAGNGPQGPLSEVATQTSNTTMPPPPNY